MKRLRERILSFSVVLAFLSILLVVFIPGRKAGEFSSYLFFIILFAACMLAVSCIIIGRELLAGKKHAEKNVQPTTRLEEQLIQINKELEAKVISKTTELGGVMERITDAFLALDKNWRFTYVNKKAAEIIGRDPQSMIGKNIWDNFTADTAHPFYIATHKAMEEQVYVNIDVYYEPYQRWFNDHIYPSPEGLSIFFRDITDKKIAEKNIADSEEKRRLIMNAALDAIICIDTKGLITFWNPQAEKIFGWQANEVIGHILSETIIPDRFRQMHNKGMAAYMETGRGPALNVLLELSAINRAGDEFPVELTVLPIKQGTEEFFCAFIRDITKRKKDMDAIRSSNERYNMVLKATHDSVWDWDLLTNKVERGEKKLETLYGHKAWEPHEVDKYWNQYAHAEDWAKVTERRNIIFKDPLQNYWEDEYRFLRMDGSYGYVTDRGYIIRDENGIAIRMIGASNDISERKTTEETLKNSELRFRSLIEKGSEIIAMHDREGRIIYISPSVTSQLGYVPEERIGKAAFEFVHPDDIPFIKNKLALLMSIPGAVDTAQWRHRHADGTWHWMEGISANLLHDPSVNAVVHNFRDISDRKRVENELLLSEEKYKLLFYLSPMPKWIFDIETYRILDVNKSAIDLYGYSREEFAEMTVTSMHPKNDTGQPASFFNKEKKYGKGIIAFGIWSHTKKNGEIIKVEMTGHLMQYNGRNCMIAVCNDITERLSAQQELIISNERFEYATKATFDAIWDSDLTNGITYWGNGFEVIFGHKLSNMQPDNDSWSDLIHPDDKVRVLKNVNSVINSSESNWSDEYRFLKANGNYAFVRDKGVIVRDENGKAVRMIGAMQDITLAKQEEQQLKNAEEELRRKNEELKQLSVYLKDVREEERKYIAREVHDELGQLASALKIDIDWLSIKNVAIDDIGKMRITHATKTIEVLISSIRKIASSLRPSVLDDFGLNAAIEWQCREFQNLSSIQCIFEADFDDEGLPMEIKTELFRMTQESLTNVMRHSKAAQVTVKLTEDDENMFLKITDDGRGFDTTVKKSTLGLIGLRERAVSISGQLRIESEPGNGTVVLAIIPKR